MELPACRYRYRLPGTAVPGTCVRYCSFRFLPAFIFVVYTDAYRALPFCLPVCSTYHLHFILPVHSWRNTGITLWSLPAFILRWVDPAITVLGSGWMQFTWSGEGSVLPLGVPPVMEEWVGRVGTCLPVSAFGITCITVAGFSAIFCLLQSCRLQRAFLPPITCRTSCLHSWKITGLPATCHLVQWVWVPFWVPFCRVLGTCLPAAITTCCLPPGFLGGLFLAVQPAVPPISGLPCRDLRHRYRSYHTCHHHYRYHFVTFLPPFILPFRYIRDFLFAWRHSVPTIPTTDGVHYLGSVDTWAFGAITILESGDTTWEVDACTTVTCLLGVLPAWNATFLGGPVTAPPGCVPATSCLLFRGMGPATIAGLWILGHCG